MQTASFFIYFFTFAMILPSNICATLARTISMIPTAAFHVGISRRIIRESIVDSAGLMRNTMEEVVTGTYFMDVK